MTIMDVSDFNTEIEEIEAGLRLKGLTDVKYEAYCNQLKSIFQEKLTSDCWNSLSSFFRGTLTALIIKLAECGHLPTHEGSDEKEQEIYLAHCNSRWPISALKTTSMAVSWITKENIKEDKHLIKKFFTPCYILCATYLIEDFESTKLLKEEAIALQFQLSNLGFGNGEYCLKNFIRNNGSENKIFNNGLLESLLAYLQIKLRKENWRKNGSFKYILYFALSSAKNDQISAFVNTFIPPSLLFVDDYNPQNEILGIKCLHKIIKAVSGAELKLYGKAEVIYSALHRLIYVREKEIIEELYPCLLDILLVIEKPHDRMHIAWNKHDSVFQQILNDMEFEQNISLRRAYSEHLYLFVNQLQIDCLKHLKRILRVIENYLEMSDGPEEITRRNILKALHKLILVTWPRIFHHVEEVLKILLKLLYSIEALDTSSEVFSVKEELTILIGVCIEAVRKLNPEGLKVICSHLNFDDMPNGMQRNWKKFIES